MPPCGLITGLRFRLRCEIPLFLFWNLDFCPSLQWIPGAKHLKFSDRADMLSPRRIQRADMLSPLICFRPGQEFLRILLIITMSTDADVHSITHPMCSHSPAATERHPPYPLRSGKPPGKLDEWRCGVGRETWFAARSWFLFLFMFQFY